MTNHQLDFAFVAELPVLASAPKPRARRNPPAPQPLVAPSPSISAPTNPPGIEAMAATVESHPDYRVLRRLKPRLHWPAAMSLETGRPDSGICRVVLLDTETTGLDQSKDRIMELALVRVDVDRATGLPVGDVQVYDGLEDPGIPIPREVQELTGIKPSDVQGQRLDEARVAELLDGVDLVIAHNAGFDRPFAEDRLAAFRGLAWACSFADIPWKAQGRRSAKLESLAQELGWFYDAHRAEMDCHALLAVLAHDLPHGGRTGLAQLLEQAQHPSYRLMATNAPFDSKDLLKARGYRWSADQKVWSTRVADSQALQTEFDWLKEHAYHQRSVVVQFEKLDAHVRYSGRPGELLYHQL